MNSGPTTGQSMGYDQSTQQQNRANSLGDQVTANNSQYNGPVTSTPYYKSLLQSGTQSTNQSYDNASRNLKQSMEGAGVGGASGAAQGNNAAMGAQRASTLGQVGTNAIQGASQMQMNANSQQLQQAGMDSGAAQGYFSGANQAELARLQQQGSLYNGLLQAGTGLGEAAILA